MLLLFCCFFSDKNTFCLLTNGFQLFLKFPCVSPTSFSYFFLMWGQFDVYWYILEAGGFCSYMPIFIVGGGKCPVGFYTRIPGAGWTGGSFLPSPTPFLIFHTPLLPSPTPCFLSPSLALLSPTPSLLSPIHSLLSPTSPLFSPTPLLPSSLNPVRPYIRLRDCPHKNQFLLGQFAQMVKKWNKKFLIENFKLQ